MTFVVLYLPSMPVVSGSFPLLKLWQTVERFLLLILADLTTQNNHQQISVM